jgi:general stress protein CsbA
MRFSALIPVVLSAAAFILTFLCLFAGSKKGFMEDYAIVTVSLLLPITSIHEMLVH